MYSIEITNARYQTIDVRNGYSALEVDDAFQACVDYYGDGTYSGGRVAMINPDGYIEESSRI